MTDNTTTECGCGHCEGGLKLEPHQIILRPLITEKGTHRSTRQNAYSFEVNRMAAKPDIKHAVESLFGVRVLEVRTQNRKGKARRSRFRQGVMRDWKKAVVKLHSDDKIDLY